MRIMQALIADATEEQIKHLEKWTHDKYLDPDYQEIYHNILECGATAYGAAKTVSETNGSKRCMKTLWRHARDIELALLDFLGGITVDSLYDKLMREGKVEVPTEILSEFRDMVSKSNDGQIEETTVFTIKVNTPPPNVF